MCLLQLCTFGCALWIEFMEYLGIYELAMALLYYEIALGLLE